MKRIFIIILCCMLLLAGCGRIEQRTLNKTQGRLLFCNNDSLMLICDGSPIVINTDGLENADLFNDGDLVEVWHDDVLTSYPGQTKAYKIELIQKGSMADIDEYVARELCQMGWIAYDDMALRYMEAGYIIDCETPDTQE
ncbi:MAG: DUF3221 domain-containing protein [Clostridia bacterium]|nr:DUF3221 domain-containing protein [Clostridia bacterium]